jgi:hypothetical protein
MQGQFIAPAGRFPIFVLVSLVVFIAILRFVTRHRNPRPHSFAVVTVAVLVVVGGMAFAKFGNHAGLPWWIYYTAPALATLIVPVVAFKLSGKALVQYLVLALLSSPAIHVAFSLLFAWHDYMPFIPVPSLESLLGHVAAAA